MYNNPYNYNQPAPPHMFFGRQAELQALLHRLTLEPGIALIGGRQIGKTSLLEALKTQLEQLPPDFGYAATITLDINLARTGFRSAGELFREVFRQASEALGNDPAIADAWFAGDLPPALAAQRALETWSRATTEQSGRCRLIALFDECEDIVNEPWAKELYLGLRALLLNQKTRGVFKIVMAGSRHFLSQVQEPGSPLRGRLALRHLYALNAEATDLLINQPTHNQLAPAIAGEVARQSGGHPFLIQYLMAALCEMDPRAADSAAVQRAITTFIRERPEFEDWLREIGDAGSTVYALLCHAPEGLTANEVLAQYHSASPSIDQLLTMLCYHGLIRERGDSGRFQIAGHMFRDWFIGQRRTGEIAAPTLPQSAPIMPTRHRLDPVPLAIHIDGGASGMLRVHVNGAGANDYADFHLPDQALVRQFRAALAAGDADTTSTRNFGIRLFESMFPIPVQRVYHFFMARLNTDRQYGRLELSIAPALASVAALPWEYLVDPAEEASLLQRGFSLIRLLNSSPPGQAFQQAGPLRVLLSAAQVPPADGIRQHLNSTYRALSALDGQLQLTLEPNLTLAKLRGHLRTGFDIWHVIGHSQVNQAEAVQLLLEDDDADPIPVNADVLAPQLANSRLQLAILNTCHSATIDQATLHSFAPALAQAGIPVVVGMQHAIAIESAQAFSSECLRALARGLPIDLCVAEGRKAILEIAGTAKPDWGLPVLYARSTSARLFETHASA